MTSPFRRRAGYGADNLGQTFGGSADDDETGFVGSYNSSGMIGGIGLESDHILMEGSTGSPSGSVHGHFPNEASLAHDVDGDSSFSFNVMAEESSRARSLQKFRQSRSRTPSFDLTNRRLIRRNTEPNKDLSRNGESEDLRTQKSDDYSIEDEDLDVNNVRDDVKGLSIDIGESYIDTSLKDSDGDEDVREDLFHEIPDPYPHTKNYQRIAIVEPGDDFEGPDVMKACTLLSDCVRLREKWISVHPKPPQDEVQFIPSRPPSPARSPGSTLDPKLKYRRRREVEYDIHFIEPLDKIETIHYEMNDGVGYLYDIHDIQGYDPTKTAQEQGIDSSRRKFTVYSFDDFVQDYMIIKNASFSGPISTFSYTRLELLAGKFALHTLLNDVREADAQKSVPHRDFYNVRKVDTHVHHSACMNQKHLLRFIKMKLRTVPNEVVIYRDDKHMTLGDVFKSLNLTAYDLSIDTLDMHAHDTFHRFDRFNLKYNPAGQSRLREIFLKTDNYLEGRYLAEITKEVFGDLDISKYQLVEWRVSVYGRNRNEWHKLATWFYKNRLWHKNVRWLIQVPRLFHIYRNAGLVDSFGTMMDNIFGPLFEITIDPKSNPALHYFLNAIVGFDSVDDESRPESGSISPIAPLPKPSNWTTPENPPYGYWMYYMYANILTLNKFRAHRGLTTFQFRPHCGEAGNIEHLISTYLVAHQINHGIKLRKNPALQYLYYLSQIGIAMSPLSNNKLFLDYAKNPFPKYFAQGMNVSLSTDDPLMLHYTKDALLEEYSVATQVWKLSSTDQNEIARRSVLQSGFEDAYKKHFLGNDYCDIRETNVPEIRLQYRQEALDEELSHVFKYIDE